MSIKKEVDITTLPEGTTAADFSPEGSHADGTVNVHLPDDIKAIGAEEEPKITLGDYLSNRTDKNAYGPKSGMTYAPKMQGAATTPEMITGGTGNANVFFKDVLDEAAAYFENLSKGGDPSTREGGTFENINKFLDKTDGVTGHTLLTQVEGDPFNDSGAPNYGSNKDPHSQRVSAVLRNNRFSPGGFSPYIQDRSYSNGMWSNQQTFGKFEEGADAPTLKELAQVGLSLMLRATGDKTDPRSASTTKSMDEGLFVQLAMQKVPNTEINTRTAAEAVISSYSNTGLQNTTVDDSFDSENSKSWGQLNSYLEPFGGALPVSMILLAVLSALAALVAGVIIGLILDLIFWLFPPGEEEMGAEPQPMGAAKGKKDFGDDSTGHRMLQYLGIPRLRSGKGFAWCMAAGVLQFYDRLAGVSAGYYTCVSRAVIRDVNQITDAFKDMPSISDPVGFVAGLYMILEAFTTSTTFQFLNTMAYLGDIIIMSGGLYGDKSYTHSPYPNGRSIDIDKPTIANLHMKSRTKAAGQDDDDYRLAWRFGSTPSMHLLPMGIQQMAINNKWGGLQMPNAASSDGMNYEKVRTETDKTRLDLADVLEIEEILDASYMPFYFHDIRTNEILSFHAFLDSVSDSFAPNWSQVEGFGRMDPVQIYKNTTRSIGCTFWVAATNKQDFDEMWYAINRLIMMVYPQWSKGMQRRDAEGNTFIQPFSQVPTASPLIRLRLGEFWKSNYSKMNLQRNFGLGSDSFALVVDSSEAQTKMQEAILPALKKANEDYTAAQKGAPPYEEMAGILAALALGATPSATQGYMPGMPAQVKGTAGEKVPFATAGDVPFTYSKTIRKFKMPDAQFPVDIIGYHVKPMIDAGSSNDDVKDQTKRQKKRRQIRYVVKPKDSSIKLPDDVEGIIVAHEHLIGGTTNAKSVWVQLQVAEAMQGGLPAPAGFPTTDATEEGMDFSSWIYGQEVNDWFSSENNAVVRSFESAGGSGLAGVITQLDFDWSNGNIITWETAPGSRAPQACKVTFSFSPIHDIPLGLAADGSMRAVPYMVGDMVRQLFGDPVQAYGDEDRIRQNHLDRVRAGEGDNTTEDDGPPDASGVG